MTDPTDTPKPEKWLHTEALMVALTRLEDYKRRRSDIRDNLARVAQKLGQEAIEGLSDPRESVRPVQGIVFEVLKDLFLAQEQRQYLTLTTAVAKVIDGATRIE
jgi:hypothetical protein